MKYPYSVWRIRAQHDGCVWFGVLKEPDDPESEAIVYTTFSPDIAREIGKALIQKSRRARWLRRLRLVSDAAFPWSRNDA